MEEFKNYEKAYLSFMDFQKELHEKNQKKIRVGFKVNILLPLVFLIISFITNGSKLIFLILWIVSLFGIAFYLLYVEFSDFKLQEKMKEFGLVSEEKEQEALIGVDVNDKIAELKELRKDLNEIKNLEVFNDIKELKANLIEEHTQTAEEIEEGGETDNEEHI